MNPKKHYDFFFKQIEATFLKLVFVYCMCICSFGICSAQCDNNQIKPDNGIFYYRHRTGDERCEGTYIKYRSGENLRLISFTVDSVYYTNSSNNKLEINVPIINYNQEINVQGNNFNMNPQNINLAYRLDMTLPEGTKKIIPLSEVINKIPISYSHLGFYGFIYQKNQQVFIPVSAIEQDPYNHTSVKWQKKDYLILLTSQIYMDEVSYSLVTQESKPQTVIASTIFGQNLNPEQVLHLSIPRKVLIEGIHNYVLKIRYKSGAVDIIPYYLFIP